MDVPVGVDPGQRVVRANGRPDAEDVPDDLPLELLHGNAETAVKRLAPHAGVLGIEPEVRRIPEADLLVKDAGEPVAETDEALPVCRERPAGAFGERPDEQAAAFGQEV